MFSSSTLVIRTGLPYMHADCACGVLATRSGEKSSTGRIPHRARKAEIEPLTLFAMERWVRYVRIRKIIACGQAEAGKIGRLPHARGQGEMDDGMMGRAVH